jgi:lipid-A-disaccharide synthase
LISAGEASGDAVGAELVAELRSKGYQGNVRAVGSRRLREAGANVIADSSGWGAIGIYHALRVAPRVFREYRRIRREIRSDPPDAFVAIDFGYVNVRLCRFAKSCGCKTLYFMPPGSWRRDKQGSDLATIADVIATPFEWSAELLRRMGASVVWVGHPIVQMSAKFPVEEQCTLAILPGSRQHEVENNLDAIAGAVNGLAPDRTGAPAVELIAAANVPTDSLSAMWRARSTTPFTVTDQPALHALKRARAAIVCSGTATLECAISGVPMVVVYRGDRMMTLEYRIRKPKFDFVALPSIIAGRSVVPELLQDAATPDAIATHVRSLLSDSPERKRQLDAFEEIRAALGPPDAITRTADALLSLVAG